MAGFEPARPLKKLHASEVTKTPEYCPRAHALMDIKGVNKPAEFIGTSMQYTFGIGRALERQMQEDWAKDIAFGNWRCVSCSKKHEMQFRPVSCVYCGKSSSGFRYDEYRFTSAISGISGGIDLMVRLPGYTKATVVEVKTMKEADWKNLKAPLKEHRERTNLYLRLVDESDDPVSKFVMTDRALIIYLVKGFGVKDDTLKEQGIKESFSPFKEYVITRDDVPTQSYTDKGAQWLDWKTTGNPPDRICTSPTCDRAVKCPVKKDCFSGPYSIWE